MTMPKKRRAKYNTSRPQKDFLKRTWIEFDGVDEEFDPMGPRDMHELILASEFKNNVSSASFLTYRIGLTSLLRVGM